MTLILTDSNLWKSKNVVAVGLFGIRKAALK